MLKIMDGPFNVCIIVSFLCFPHRGRALHWVKHDCMSVFTSGKYGVSLSIFMHQSM